MFVWRDRVDAFDINYNSNDWTVIERENADKVFSICSDKYLIQFNSSNGAISQLVDNENNITYANGQSGNTLGQFWYQALNNSLRGTHGNLKLPNVYITTNLTKIYQNIENTERFIVEMRFESDTFSYSQLCTNYSCINTIFNEIEINCDSRSIEFNIDLINKTITRVPETVYFSFNPLSCTQWTVASYDNPVKVNDIIEKGSFNIYAYGIDGNVTCQLTDNGNINDKLNFESIDIGLTSWKPIVYDNPMADGQWLWANGYYVNSSQTDGFAFELVNNMWSTNYPQWYPFDPIDSNITYNVVMYF